MRKLLVSLCMAFVFVLEVHADKVLYVTEVGDTTILAILSPPQVHALEYSLLDIEDWIKKAVQGKLENCQSRMIQEWTPKLQADSTVKSIPIKVDELIEFIYRRPDYINRVMREEKERSLRTGP